LLLKAGQAAVYRTYPFTLILKRKVEQSTCAPLRLKIDPGAKTTGLALLNDVTGQVIWAAELTHRGEQIKKVLYKRRGVRRGRRFRRTRYRAPRFSNRRRRTGWLPPSLLSRVENILTWVKRISQIAPVTALSQELVRFDLQKMETPEISGIQYQQGTLFGYELREYVLEKWNRQCAYCGATGHPLQIEHIVARANGGTDRVSNLTLACMSCNQKKGVQEIRDFLADQPERLTRVLTQAKAPMIDATAVNATRWKLFRRLQDSGLPLETGSGGRTKYNRSLRGFPKTHWLDAACVRASTPKQLSTKGVVPLLITATGRGRRKMCNSNDLGFPTGHRKRRRRYFGFQTGDLVRAVVPEGFVTARVPMLGGSWSVRQGNLTSLPHRGAWLVFPIGFVIREAATMAIATRKGDRMPQTQPPSPPNKERPFLPRINDGGILARFGDPSAGTAHSREGGQNNTFARCFPFPHALCFLKSDWW
jgi:5-methylcytosine-specific restriction endonuclease McrA